MRSEGFLSISADGGLNVNAVLERARYLHGSGGVGGVASSARFAGRAK